MDLLSWASASSSYTASQRWFRGDFNGDGMDDLITMPYGRSTLRLDIYRSARSSFVPSTWWNSTERAQTDRYLVADCTGDGADDLIRIYNIAGNIRCAVFSKNREGSEFVRSLWTPGYPYDANHRWYPGDYDGDGNEDFALLRADAGEGKVDVLLSSGSSFSVSSNWIGAGTSYTYGDEMWYPGDFNGDRISDLAKISGDGNYLTAEVFISTGSEFVGTTWTSGQGAYQDEADLFLIDFNGDNKQDIICVKPERLSKHHRCLHINWYRIHTPTADLCPVRSVQQPAGRSGHPAA